MSDPRLPFRVARLVVAAAWADGDVSRPERTFLRKRFGDMPQITGADWAVLSDLLDDPMSRADQEAALAKVTEVIQSKDDKVFVLDTVVELVAADGIVTDPEIELVEQVKSALDATPTGVMGRLSRLVGGLLRGGRSDGEA